MKSMMMKKTCFLAVLLLLLSLSVVGISMTACQKSGESEETSSESAESSSVPAEDLSTPVNLAVSDDVILTWDAVENACGYRVEIDGNEYEAETNRFDIFYLTVVGDSFSIRVKACGDSDSYRDSAWSEAIEYSVELCFNLEVRPIKNNTEYRVIVQDPSQMVGRVVIPPKFTDGKLITSIAINAFANCTELTAVVIPDSVTEIGDYAFHNCTNLKRVRLPNHTEMETIGTRTFSQCSSLTEITIPAPVKTIGLGAFEYCTSLRSVTFPDGLTRLENIAFSGCSSLTGIVLPQFVESIGVSVFSECDSLTSLTVEERNSASHVYRSEGNCIIRIADSALVAGCNGSVIPDGVKTIESKAFSGCRKMTEITIPGSVTEIKEWAFSNCSGLKSVTLSEGVKIIGDPLSVGNCEVFWKCVALTDITVPASVEFIGPGLFSTAWNMTEIRVAEGNRVYQSDGNCIIRKSDLEVVTGCTVSVIPDYVKSIGNSAFYNCPISEAVFPDGLEKIGKCAFARSLLLHISIPASVKEIGTGAFDECNYLLSVTLPASVEKIGSGAFYNATVYHDGEADYWGDGWAMPGDFLNRGCFQVSCEKVKCCKFAYENGQPYVVSFRYVNDQSVYSISVGMKHNAPYRKGYTFAGWTTEQGGTQAMYGIPTASTVANLVGYFHLDKEEMLEKVPSGTVLYAVWIPDSE